MSSAPRSRPDIDALRARYIAEKRLEELHGNWAMVVLHRPLAFRLSALALRQGWSAMHLTGAAAMFAVGIPVAAALLPTVWLGAAAVLLLAHVAIVLDCSDGDVARATGSASRRGADFDLFVDMLLWGGLYLALGILSDRAATGAGPGFWTAVALIAAWLRLFAQLVKQRSPQGAPPDAPPRGVKARLFAGIAGLDGLLPFLALMVIRPGAAIWPILLLAALDLASALWSWARHPAHN
jgi:phosphatidylglycerophosphate synthase